MNHEETKAAIAVMQAYVDGKEIEFKVRNSDEWVLGDKYLDWVWMWEKYEYRVKKEPLEFWVNVYKDEHLERTAFHTKSAAEFHADKSEKRWIKAVKVREVEE